MKDLIEKIITKVIDCDKELQPVLVTTNPYLDREDAGFMASCSCYVICGSNFSMNGKCECYTSCGMNYSKC